MSVYDDQTNLITSLSGAIDANGYCDDPNTGNPGISVSLLDTNGNNFASESYTVAITASGMTTGLTAQNNGRVHPNAGGGGGSSSGTRKYFYSHPMTGHNWVIAFYPAYGYAEFGNQAALDLGEMMGASVGAVINNQSYGSEGVVNQGYTSADGQAALSLDASRQWNQLSGLLADNSAHNFFYFGHGAVDFIGRKYSDKITSSNLVAILGNNINSGIQAIYGPLHHAYRFVFLDGCNTAKGNLPAAFGIPPVQVSEDDWNNKYFLQPRSFLGWSSYTAASVKNTLPVDHKMFIENFWQGWGNNNAAHLNDALGNAAINNDTGQRFTQLDHKITLYGDPILPFYQ
jgi:hypothetical protein